MPCDLYVQVHDNLALCFTMGKAHEWGAVSKCKVGLGYHLGCGLYWNHAHTWFLLVWPLIPVNPMVKPMSFVSTLNISSTKGVWKSITNWTQKDIYIIELSVKSAQFPSPPPFWTAIFQSIPSFLLFAKSAELGTKWKIGDQIEKIRDEKQTFGLPKFKIFLWWFLTVWVWCVDFQNWGGGLMDF